MAFRKQFIINRPLQYMIIGFSLGMSAIAILLLFLENYYLYSLFMNDEYAGLFADSGILDLVLQDWRRAMAIMVFTGAGMLCLIAFCGLVLSNKIAGPIYRLRKHMDEIAGGGEITPLKVRKGDYFQETVDSYNEFLKKMEN